ncbi:MAG: trehalose-phosphatase [Candidatus Saganbacteria bacterium]|nr:trehalose-phosphatase [Candidatus Saganbacteria bacterium]
MQKKIFVFLDYDGTLTPIVKKPQLAKLSAARKKILKRVAKDKNVQMAIVSGRGIKNVKSFVGLSGIHYVGNHGFQIDKWVHPKARSAKESIAKIIRDIKQKLKKVKGIIYEDKIYTASIHYRLVPTIMHGKEMTSDLDRLFACFNEIVRPYVARKKLMVTYGKKVLEIRPQVEWNKGEAVLMLLKKAGGVGKYFPVYIGDDTTDEDAFKAIGRSGLTIFVGDSKKTSADYFLSKVDDVYQFLNGLSAESIERFMAQKKQA